MCFSVYKILETPTHSHKLFKNYYDKIFKIMLIFYQQQQQQHLQQWKHCQQQQNGIWKYNNSPENQEKKIR